MAYEKRDAAFKRWEKSSVIEVPELRHLNPGLQEAFNAGWNARKVAQYVQMYDIKEPN